MTAPLPVVRTHWLDRWSSLRLFVTFVAAGLPPTVLVAYGLAVAHSVPPTVQGFVEPSLSIPVPSSSLTPPLTSSPRAPAPVVVVSTPAGLVAYRDCDEVYAEGRSHVTPADPRWHPRLDGHDQDGVGCEGSPPPSSTSSSPTAAPSTTSPPPASTTEPAPTTEPEPTTEPTPEPEPPPTDGAIILVTLSPQLRVG